MLVAATSPCYRKLERFRRESIGRSKLDPPRGRGRGPEAPFKLASLACPFDFVDTICIMGGQVANAAKPFMSRDSKSNKSRKSLQRVLAASKR